MKIRLSEKHAGGSWRQLQHHQFVHILEVPGRGWKLGRLFYWDKEAAIRHAFFVFAKPLVVVFPYRESTEVYERVTK